MEPAPSGYTLKDAARLLDLPVPKLQTLIKAGLVLPSRGTRGEFRLTFQDLVVLRSAAQILDRVPPKRLRKALARLREQRREEGLTGVRLEAHGSALLAHDGHETWDLESGQVWIDFGNDHAPGAEATTPSVLHLKSAAPPHPPGLGLDAEDWYMKGCELESSDPAAARAAYVCAIEIDPRHVDARINLGRLLHETRDLAGAETQYRAALDASPADATAAFNLGVVLEDLSKPVPAVAAYKQAIAADPNHADAHYNLSHVYEAMGNRRNAIRHLDIYRKLMRGA